MVAKKKLLRTGRRNFLRALVGLGVSTSTVSAFAKEVPADVEYDPETEVPRIHGYRHTNHEAVVEEGAPPEREPVYAVISREKWRMVESGDDVRRRVQQRLSDLDPTPLVAVRVPKGSDDLDPRTVVVKHVTEVTDGPGGGRATSSPGYSPDELSEIVRDRFAGSMTGVAGRGTAAESAVEDVPVVSEAVELGQSDYYDYEYRTDGVPPGCAIETDGGGRGTLGPYAFDGDTYSYVFVTAGHLVDGDDDVYQNDQGVSGDHLGSVNDQKVRTDKDFDAGVVFGLDFSGSDQFAADSPDSYHGPTITGVQTRTALLDMQGTSETLHKQGIATQDHADTVYDVHSTSFDTWHNESGGDSGGPYWRETGGDALISGVHQGSVSGYLSHATIMESIEDDFNVTV